MRAIDMLSHTLVYCSQSIHHLRLFSTRPNHSRDAKRSDGILFATRDRDHIASEKRVAINFCKAL